MYLIITRFRVDEDDKGTRVGRLRGAYEAIGRDSVNIDGRQNGDTTHAEVATFHIVIFTAAVHL